MANPNPPVGVAAFELRLTALDPKHRDHPVALTVAVAGSGQVTEIAAGSRAEMRAARNALLIAIRSNRAPLEALAQALAPLVREAIRA